MALVLAGSGLDWTGLEEAAVKRGYSIGLERDGDNDE